MVHYKANEMQSDIAKCKATSKNWNFSNMFLNQVMAFGLLLLLLAPNAPGAVGSPNCRKLDSYYTMTKFNHVY